MIAVLLIAIKVDRLESRAKSSRQRPGAESDADFVAVVGSSYSGRHVILDAIINGTSTMPADKCLLEVGRHDRGSSERIAVA